MFMTINKQQTLSRKVSFQGIGLHSGKLSKINIFPAKEDHGITFKRVDLAKNNLIEAKFSNVVSTKLCTTLANDQGAKVSTVEHLLAALYIHGIDNAVIEIDNEEVPIMDGSAKNFLEELRSTDIIEQSKKRNYLKVTKKIELFDGNRKISIEPCNTFEVKFQLNYKNQVIGNQENLINFDKDNLEEVYGSRTFCLFDDIEKIKKAGLAKGGSLDNAVVVKDTGVMNEGGLRNKKEFVNHKILDLAGDFVLSGYRILGRINCHQGGHELSNMFLKKLMHNSNKNCFELTNQVKKVPAAKKFINFHSEKVAAIA